MTSPSLPSPPPEIHWETTLKKQRDARQLLKRPISTPEELEQLAAWIERRQAALYERGRVVMALITTVVVLATFVVATDTNVPRSELLILPSMLLLGVTIALPIALRRRWAAPRLLVTQRRQLQDRGQQGKELGEPDAMLADLENRISQTEALLRRDHAPATDQVASSSSDRSEEP